MSLPQDFLDALPSVQAAADASSGDHKHLVNIYMPGGMDNLNTLYPTGSTPYAAYAAMRGSLAQPQSGGQALTGQGASLHSLMPKLKAKFNAGKLAILANYGNLARPITKLQYETNLVIKPLVLFSHADQEKEFKTGLPLSPASDRGWGGRAWDLIDPTYNPGAAAPSTLGVNTNSVLLAGWTPLQYQTGYTGAAQIEASADQSDIDFVRSFAAGTSGTYILEGEIAVKVGRGNSLGVSINAAIAGIDPSGFPNTNLGGLLKMAARLIAARVALGHRRSIIQIQWGGAGWDTHNGLFAVHNASLPEFDDAVDAFHEATKTLGPSGASLENEVVLFTATDFGRCGTPNGDGTDHGWGGNAYIIGGKVIGGHIYRKEDGTSASMTLDSHHDVTLGGKNDAGQGRLIPTTSTLEYAATMLKWAGMPAGTAGSPAPAMVCALPDIGYFPMPDLGFMTP